MLIKFSGLDLFNWYQQAKKEAIAFNIPVTELDWLLQELTDLDSLSLRTNNYLEQLEINSLVSLAKLKQLWQKRLKNRCPVQYLVEKCYWRNFTLKVTPDVLIPRPETEIIIDIVAEITNQHPQLKKGNWLDLGTGSGAIAIGLAEILPEINIYAVDKSKAALNIAQENAQILGYQERIKFYHGLWFTPLQGLDLKFSGIVSNPPYIPSSLISQLQPEVANHEPKMALDGGNDGLNDIRHLIKHGSDFLQDSGILLLEIMQGQEQQVINLLRDKKEYNNIHSYQDLANIYRFILAQKN